MIKLTKNQVFKAALKAYEAKGLSAQGPTPRCEYRDPSGLPCAVGAAINLDDLSEDERRELLNNDLGSVGSSTFGGVFFIPAEDYQSVGLIQRLHDNWALAAKSLHHTDKKDEVLFTYRERRLAEAEKTFVGALNRG